MVLGNLWLLVDGSLVVVTKATLYFVIPNLEVAREVNNGKSTEYNTIKCFFNEYALRSGLIT